MSRLPTDELLFLLLAVCLLTTRPGLPQAEILPSLASTMTFLALPSALVAEEHVRLALDDLAEDLLP